MRSAFGAEEYASASKRGLFSSSRGHYTDPAWQGQRHPRHQRLSHSSPLLSHLGGAEPVSRSVCVVSRSICDHCGSVCGARYIVHPGKTSPNRRNALKKGHHGGTIISVYALLSMSSKRDCKSSHLASISLISFSTEGASSNSGKINSLLS